MTPLLLRRGSDLCEFLALLLDLQRQHTQPARRFVFPKQGRELAVARRALQGLAHLIVARGHRRPPLRRRGANLETIAVAHGGVISLFPPRTPAGKLRASGRVGLPGRQDHVDRFSSPATTAPPVAGCYPAARRLIHLKARGRRSL